MTENLKKFLEAASKNEELRRKLSSASQETIFIEAKALGFELTEADFHPPSGELSEDELEAVTGGKDCICIVYGLGKASGHDDRCECPFYGQGYGWYDTQRYQPGYEWVDERVWEVRCGCLVSGSGGDGYDF